MASTLHSRLGCAVLDVHYPASGGARTGLVVTDDVRCAQPWSELVTETAEVEPYVPGQFWRRELPPILAALVAWAETGGAGPGLIVVDGFVTLDPKGRPGLGAHVHDVTELPVIGLAKTPFATATHAVGVVRGAATRPLYVTAIGLGAVEAAAIVQAMDGEFRVPDAARRVDRLARGASPAHVGLPKA